MRLKIAAASLLGVLMLASVIVVLMPGASYARQDREAPLAAASSRHPAG